MDRYKGYTIRQYTGNGAYYALWGYAVEFEAKTLGALKGKITNYLNSLDN